VIKDIRKTLVYALARYRKPHRQRHCAGDPGAHHHARAERGTACEQLDQDCLPPYDTLDGGTISLKALAALHVALDDAVQSVVRRQTVLIQLLGTQFRARRARDDALRITGAVPLPMRFR